MSFSWYTLSCQRYNWPIPRWHLEYLGKLSTCNCEDLELVCYFGFSLTVFLRNSFFQAAETQRDFWEIWCCPPSRGKLENFHLFLLWDNSATIFPQIFSFWILGVAMVIKIPTLQSCYEDLRRHQPCINSMHVLQYACFQGFSCMLCMYFMHILCIFFKPFDEVIGGQRKYK